MVLIPPEEFIDENGYGVVFQGGGGFPSLTAGKFMFTVVLVYWSALACFLGVSFYNFLSGTIFPSWQVV